MPERGISLEADVDEVLAVPLMRFLGVRYAGHGPGSARLSLTVGAQALNGNGSLHAGALYALLDVVGYLAAMPSFERGQTATTHTINVSLMRPVAEGAELELEGRVLKRGRSLIFVQSEARVGDKEVALATVCKSIVGPGGSNSPGKGPV
jgi:uncharacterized protein (TIGR00369 family)